MSSNKEKKHNQDKKEIFLSFNFWRYLINAWTILFFLVTIYNFFTNNSCLETLNLIAMIYIGVLTVYVSNKEFERWYRNHQRQRHPGEIFVVIWTLLIVFLVVCGLILKKASYLPPSVVSSYIAVLTILAITKKSKQIYIAHRSNN